MKTALIIIAVIGGFIGLSALGIALNIITIPFHKLGSQIQLNHDLIDKTYDADNALYNYHWFQERAEAIKGDRNKIVQADQSVKDFELSAGIRKDWTFEDKTEDARLRAVLQGLRSHYEDLANEYNARAKEADRAIFKDELPTIFSLDPFFK